VPTAVVSEPIPPPAIAGIFPPRVRALIYLSAAMLAPAYAVVEANTNLHFGWVAGYAAWNGLVGVLAAANTSAGAAVLAGPAPGDPNLPVVDG
jgi:hypothetical protein